MKNCCGEFTQFITMCGRITIALCALAALWFFTNATTISPLLPKPVMNCYRRNFSATIPKVPHTVQTLIELIRKLEQQSAANMNIRHLTSSMFFEVKLDGIEETEARIENEFVIPYKATGRQYYKFRMLGEHFLSEGGQRFPDTVLTQQELCIFHNLISNTLYAWERGNERSTCGVRAVGADFTRKNASRRLKSLCPAEHGVVKTRWGSVSAGHLLAGIVAGLEEEKVDVQTLMVDLEQKLNVTFKTDVFNSVKIHNVLVATIVGDLAEVVLNQGDKNPIPTFGYPGYWNSTLYPTEYYVSDERWDMTSAELLGGLDGLILARRIREWNEILNSLKFSQILDMYYSQRGIGFDSSYRACDRQNKLVPIFRDFDIAQQIGATAQLLQTFGGYSTAMYSKTIVKYAAKVSDTFRKFAEKAVSNVNNCEEVVRIRNNLELIAIFDGTWKPDELLTVISYLAESTDVSHHGSKLGIINGQTGRWMVNMTSSVVDIFSTLANVTSRPERLHLSESLNTVTTYFQTRELPGCEASKGRPFASAVVVFAKTSRMTSQDLDASKTALRTIRGANPEARLLFVTSDLTQDRYEELGYGKVFATGSHTRDVVPAVVARLADVPANLVDFSCEKQTRDLEDYVTPGAGRSYEVGEAYARRAFVEVRFRGNGYGGFTVCAGDPDRAASCQRIAGSGEVTFDVAAICAPKKVCNVVFEVSANESRYKCVELDCRYPDQIRIDITTFWSSGADVVLPSAMMVIMVVGASFLGDGP